MSRLRRVLHPSDFSRASGAAFARAVSMAKADRAQLLLVHVVAPRVCPAVRWASCGPPSKTTLPVASTAPLASL